MRTSQRLPDRPPRSAVAQVVHQSEGSGDVKLIRRVARDDGFGLIETVVALLIAGIVFTALATTLVASVQASLFGRQNQQAADMMTTQLEQMRTLGYGSLAMQSGDLAGDPRLVSCASTKCLVVDGTPEPVVVGTAGGVFPHVVTTADVTTNMTNFTVATYITQLSGQPIDRALRASIFITWSTKGTVHTRSTSSIIAYSQSGLPLPVFKLAALPSAISVNPGATVTYALTLTNQGAPDRWNLTLSGATTGWSWYADTNASGVKDVGDAVMTDTSLDGIIDTGRIDPSKTFTFFLTRTVPSGEAAGVKPTTITATSVGQPTASGAAASVTVTTTVLTGTSTATPTATSSTPPGLVTCAAVATPPPLPGVSGYTLTAYYLHNNGIGDTTAQAQMPMDTTAVGQTSLAHYSTDVDPAALGRVLLSSGGSLPAVSSILTSSATNSVADWQMTVKKGDVSGKSVVHLWFAAHGAPGATSARVVLYTADSPSKAKSDLATADITLTPGCAGFQEVYVTLPTTTTAFKNNDVVGVRVAVAGGEAALGYDVSQMQASFTIAAN